MKYFTNIKTLGELRNVYRKLVKEFHPDNGGDVKITQEINAEYEVLFNQLKDKARENKENSFENFNVDIDIILREKINNIINIEADIEIIGSWIWVSGNTYPFKNILKSNGFKWSKKKSAWYFHSEPFQKRSNKIFSLEEIRDFYGSTKVETSPQIQIA